MSTKMLVFAKQFPWNACVLAANQYFVPLEFGMSPRYILCRVGSTNLDSLIGRSFFNGNDKTYYRQKINIKGGVLGPYYTAHYLTY